MDTDKGYTLVEMLVVLAIMSFALALVAPNLSQAIDNSRVKATVRDIASSLKATRSKAITSDETQLVLFNVNDKSFVDHKQTRSLDIPESVSLDLVTADTEQVSEEEAGIRFYKDGSSTGGQVKLEHGEITYVVDVNWLTGKVSIYP